ncbi:MAG: hypothetical protein IJ169_07280 [Paludibacteraceae bacterium]|nr:hypothetical protein [Paludibacteraceae bacterium]
MKNQTIFLFAALAAGIGLVSCNPSGQPGTEPETDLPEWYYTGGKLGTSFLATSTCFEQPAPAVDEAGKVTLFNQGDQIAEKSFMSNPAGTRGGLGPIYVRASCQHCHPGYSHGQSVDEGTYDAANLGNGTLLVVYDPADNGYVPWLAGMPQLFGTAPFKAPLDPQKITVTWRTAVPESNLKSPFPDGEAFELQYPEVRLPKEAVYIYNQGYTDDPDGKKKLALLQSEGYVTVLENTIGIYGTGLLDAITDADIIAQYDKEAADGKLKNGLNPAFYDGGFKESGYYKNDPQWGPKRFTYALTRGPLQDAAGANAIWNITNVTRSDRKSHYLDMNGTIYATVASKDKEVQDGFEAYISQITTKEEHPEWFTDDMEKNIYDYLTSKNLPVEMTDAEFTQFMVWHRGLAVPAARNINDPQVLRGKELFSELGCDYCHRPSWTTGPDDYRDPNGFFKGGELPRYPNQKIWPYTDMVQHKLMMKNDIRTGWCRTTPLWGRGLHRKATGDASEARMHDTRARNVIEAIMWHGYSTESDAYYPTEKFYNLPKADRDAVVAFINAI